MNKMCEQPYNGWKGGWGTWYVALMLNDGLYEEQDYRFSKMGEFRDFIDELLEQGYGEMERTNYDYLCAAHHECDYWEIAESFGVKPDDDS